MIDKFYSPEEAAELLGVNASTIRAWLRTGQLKGTKLGGHIWRVSEEALNNFIKAGEATGEEPENESPDISFVIPKTSAQKENTPKTKIKEPEKPKGGEEG